MTRAAMRVQVAELQGFKYFEMVCELVQRLRSVGAERDKAGNREMFCDQYLSLMLTLLAEADRVTQVLPADARAHCNSISMAEAGCAGPAVTKSWSP